MKKLALAVAVLAVAPALHAEGFTPAERASIEAVSRYLASGDAQGFVDQLAPDSPLRDLTAAEAKEEVLARTGPAAGATWALRSVAHGGILSNVAWHVEYPSGYDDGLLMRMKPVAGAWRIYDITSLGEPILPQRQASKGFLKARMNPSRSLPVRPGVRALLALITAGCLALARITSRVSRVFAAVFSIAALGVVILAGVLKLAPDFAGPLIPHEVAVATGATKLGPEGMTELRDLAPLRASLARELKGKPPATMSAETREVAALWLMRAGFVVTDPKLEELKFAGETPLAYLVRAERALATSQRSEADRAYQSATRCGPSRDDVLLEAVLFAEYPKPFVERMHSQGTRDATAFYAKAANRIESDFKEGQELFATAWAMHPIPREQIVREPHLFAAVHDEHLIRLTSLFEPAEPAIRPLSFATESIPWPANAHAFVSGEFLEVEIGDALVVVDGGAALAPQSAEVVSSTHWQEAETRKALDDAKTLLALSERPKTPIMRRRLERATEALADHNRWSDVLALTADIKPENASVSRDLLLQRSVALTRAGQSDAAHALLAGSAVTQLISDRDDPSTLVAFGDLASGLKDEALARRLYESAARQEQWKAVVTQRLDALERRQNLARSSLLVSTANFDIRYDPRMNASVASRIGDVLEEELKRLSAKLPSLRFRRTTVNVLFWQDFRGDTGSDHILGLYDGEIFVPFAEIQRFKESVVAILTHELTHAIVAQLTSDNAPRWFQEGIAQRMEFVQSQPNVFKNRPVTDVLPIALLDAIMDNTFNPYATSDGYVTAETFMHFLEDRYGANALSNMVREFAKGNNAEDALATVTGKPLPVLDAEFRDWGHGHSNDFVDNTPWPYLRLYSPEVDPTIRAGFTFTKKKS